MKKLLIVLSTMFLFNVSKAQDSLRHFEFGVSLLTVNRFVTNYNLPADRPNVEFINGVFFRYSRKKLGFRFLVSYSENSADDNVSPFWNYYYGNVHNKDFRIGPGIQYALLKRKQWLYTFFDLYYRNVSSTGYYYRLGGNYSSVSNGFDSFFGLGFRIKTFKHVYLSPELGYYISDKFVHTKSQSFIPARIEFRENDFISLPVLKVHLTAKF